MFERYTEKSRKAIFFARYEASQAGSQHIEAEHLLLGLLRTDEPLAQRLIRPESIESIRTQIHKRYSGRKKISTSVDLPLSEECKHVLAHGAEEALTRHHQHIEPQHLLLGLLREETCAAAAIMREHGLTFSFLEGVVFAPAQSSPPASDFRDLTAAARNRSLSPLIGRERELERAIQILSRRTRNNPVLVGEPGVGKSAIVEGLAQRIADEAVPPLLRGRPVFAIDANALIASILDGKLLPIADHAKAILYVDGLFDLAEKRTAWSVIETIHSVELFLASGGRQCIATGTPFGLRMTQERDETLARHFEVVAVMPPSEAEAIQIVSGAKQQYETFHGVTFADGAVETAVSASRWFLRHRQLPDRAFDLIDDAGARVALRREDSKIVTAGDVIEAAAERGGVPLAAVKNLLQTKQSDALELVVKELTAKIPHGREWIEGMAAYLAGCSAKEAEGLAKAIRGAANAGRRHVSRGAS
jgi:ATP-dependent Clp protease ATP-binding subunit ClpC